MKIKNVFSRSFFQKILPLCMVSIQEHFIIKVKLWWQLWQYGLWSFQTGYTKLERFLHKSQHTQRKLLNFENWFSGELSELSIIFVIKFSKNVNDKKCGPKLVIGLWRSILALFDTSALHRCSKIKISLWVCWILGTNLETPYTSIATRVSSFYMTQVS